MKRNRLVVPAAIAILAVSTTIALKANDDKSDTQQFKFQPNSLVLSRSVYTGHGWADTAARMRGGKCSGDVDRGRYEQGGSGVRSGNRQRRISQP